MEDSSMGFRLRLIARRHAEVWTRALAIRTLSRVNFLAGDVFYMDRASRQGCRRGFQDLTAEMCTAHTKMKSAHALG